MDSRAGERRLRDDLERLPRSMAWLPILLVAAVKVGGSMAFSARYGWHRDELYYVAAGHHLELGYVDFPPITPLVAELTQAIAPGSLVALRLASVLAGAVVVVVTALIARDLGGGRWAQVVAAAAVAVSPLYLLADFLYGTDALDQLTWVLLLWVVLRILRGGDRRLWLAAGAIVGVGLETKYTMAALVVAIGGGLLLTRARRHLASPWLWAALGLAVLLFVPNLIWQVSNDWISASYTLTHRANTGSRLGYGLLQIFQLQPALMPLAIAGAIWLLRSPTFRPLFWTVLIVELLFLVVDGKSYYPGPVYSVLYAAGSVWAVRAVRSRPLQAGWVAATVLITIVLLPITLPVLSPSAFARSGLAPAQTDFAEMYGWPGFARQVATVYRSLPPAQRSHAVILASNYGEAGALDLYGGADGVPASRVVSPHLTYYYWAPPRMDPQVVVTVGYPRSELTHVFGSCVRAATIRMPYGIQNQEQGAPVLVCRNPRRPLWQSWPSLQSLD